MTSAALPDFLAPGRPGHLVLADGTVFPGRILGGEAACTGEVVFTTGMTGYQEVLSDPSYTGQILTLTAPQIGNVGINAEDYESVSSLPTAAALVIRDLSPTPSNWRTLEPLLAWLAAHGRAIITGVDTRRLTRHLRDHGSQNGAIGSDPVADLIDRAKAAPSMQGLDLVREVTPKKPYTWDEGSGAWQTLQANGARPHVVAYDFGIKRNILRCLVDAGCRVTAVPATTSAAEALALEPDGIFLSNGPGDPAAVQGVIPILQELLGKRPLFGICLGHQLLARAMGASTFKLKFGHRGVNQPVVDLESRRVWITSQNHGFAVDVDSLPRGTRATYTHLTDGTSEGLAVSDANAFSVQFHPEAAPGPHDAQELFVRFRDRMRGAA